METLRTRNSESSGERDVPVNQVGNSASIGKRSGLKMAQLSEPLASELQKLERQFVVDQSKLKQILDRFIEELEEGLRVDGSNIPMNMTWVMGLPTGEERGTFLTLDMGGTNFRVCKVTLSDKKGEHEISQEEYRMPDRLKTGTAENLYHNIGESLDTFLKGQDLTKGKKKLPLGFTFSYPTTQERIDHGKLQTWTKGLQITGVEGEDVAAQLRVELEKRVRLQLLRRNLVTSTLIQP